VVAGQVLTERPASSPRGAARHVCRSDVESGAFAPSWQARCPTCRCWFCLNDVIPLAGADIDDPSDLVRECC
jgi:hypothetical protein